MATRRHTFVVPVAEIATALLAQTEVVPRAQVIAHQVAKIFPDTAAVVYVIHDQENPAWTAKAAAGDITVGEVMDFNVGTLGAVAKSRTPLLVDHEVVQLPSASVLRLLRHETASRQSPPKQVFVLADPVFSANDPRVRRRDHQQGSSPAAKNRAVAKDGEGIATDVEASQLARSASDVGVTRKGEALPRLEGTREEARSIVALDGAQSKLALDFEASRTTATSAELSQYRYLHFATHGLVDTQHPELSGLVLSMVNERGEPVNGFLRLQDIFNLNLPVELVVLSACETGIGKEVRGEGLLGLTRGFMYAGAPRVVVSLWKVDDAATAELMGRFYEGMLVRKLPPAAALRAAQLAMWQDSRWRAPYYWAAFVLQGEWN